MKKSDKYGLLKYTGDIENLCGMREFEYLEGPARGLRAVNIKNGRGLELTVLRDRCLDVPYATFRGINIGFTSKAGLRSPQYFVEDGARGFLKSFNAGLLTTCGITQAGGACEDEGRALGLHGVIGNTPASDFCKDVVYEEAGAMLRVRGSMQEVCVFGENVFLHRELKVDTEADVVYIDDVVENCAFAPVPVMNVYHINFGFPLLKEGARLYFSADNVAPRDKEAADNIDKYSYVEEPQIGKPEQVFVHTCDSVQRDAFAMIHNEEMGIAVVVHYDTTQCPLLCQWKCMMAGEYAVGLEPTVCGVGGRAQARAEGTLEYLEPGMTRSFNLVLEFLDDADEIQRRIKLTKEGE